MFDRLRGALRAALDAATPPEDDLRRLARAMREALTEAKAAVAEQRQAITRVEAELAAERQRLTDAERRGRLAREIQDGDTVAVAQRFAAKHRERVGVIEHKLAAQREELALAEREVQEMREELARAERDRPATEAERAAERAWRELQRAGMSRPTEDPNSEQTAFDLDTEVRERLAEQQLRELKKRMRKD